MTDDLVKRLREDQPVTQDWASTMKCGLMDEAADRIEALTAEVRRWQGLFDEKHSLILEQKAHAEKAEADNARLREAIDYILDGMGIYEPDYTIDPEDDFLDVANSKWVRDTLEQLARALNIGKKQP
jgi:hypothetical protein